MTPRFAAAVAALTVLLAAASARANGRFPAANQIVVSPSTPTVLVLRSTFGYGFSRDLGCNWDWVCENALGYVDAEDPFIGLTADDTMLAATAYGLARSPDTGCTWAFAGSGLTGLNVNDFTFRPGNAHAVVAVTSTPGAGDAGFGNYQNALFLSNDDGATWAPLGTPLTDPVVAALTVDLTPADPNRVYVSSLRGFNAAATGQLWVSTDGGSTWAERSVPFVPGETAPFIAGVDPVNADRVYVRTQAQTVADGSVIYNSRLLVTSDAGKTWTVAFVGGQLLGFALSPDGSRVYLGGPTEGLLEAPSSTMAFVQKAPFAVRCITATATALYVCSDDVTAPLVGRSDDDGATFTPLLHLATFRGPLACPAGTQSAVCPSVWVGYPGQPGIETILGGEAAPGQCGGTPPVDAGAGSGADAGSGPPPPSSKGCGCGPSAGASLAPPAALVALAFALLAVVRRRR